MVAGNAYLAARAQQVGARWLKITPTVVDIARYVPRNAGPQTEELHTPDDPRPLRIGWISTMTAMHFVRTLAAPLQLPGIHTETVAWNETGEAGEIARVDVGIMPLPDSPWERGKCGYTLVQYTACGVPVVASPVCVNRERVEPELNG